MTAVELVSPFGPTRLPRQSAADLAGLMKVFTDPARLMILSVLHHRGDQGVNMGQLGRAIGHLTPSTVTYHLKTLAGAGLVTREHVGSMVVCRLDHDRLTAVAAALAPGGLL